MLDDFLMFTDETKKDPFPIQKIIFFLLGTQMPQPNLRLILEPAKPPHTSSRTTTFKQLI
jgi:hypothetical protein